MPVSPPALSDAELIDALYRIPEHGKAEIVEGAIVRMSPTGAWPRRAATIIASLLIHYEQQFGGGYAFGDNIGFLVHLPNRRSFSPDAAWYTGVLVPGNMKFVEGAPVLAVEVRRVNDYGPKAERAILRKIADYFAAGTLVVWDVDVQSLEPDAEVIRAYFASAPDTPVIFSRGTTAHAEPAVPGWLLEIDRLFTFPPKSKVQE